MSINIYWCSPTDLNNQYDWGILYENLDNLYTSLYEIRNKDEFGRSFLKCSAFQKLAKNTFILNNPIKSSYEFSYNQEVTYTHPSSLAVQFMRGPSISNNIIFKYSLPIIFFSEESVEINFTAPYFSRAKHLNYGAVCPGSYDISKWYRPVQIEINLWDGVDKFSIEENEPLAYINFNTNKKINLIRYQETDTLKRISNTCSISGAWEPNVSLIKRYKRFLSSKTNKVVIKEIKNNII